MEDIREHEPVNYPVMPNGRWIKENWQMIIFIVGFLFVGGQIYNRITRLEADVTILQAETKQITTLITDVAVIKENIQFIKEKLSED